MYLLRTRQLNYHTSRHIRGLPFHLEVMLTELQVGHQRRIYSQLCNPIS